MKCQKCFNDFEEKDIQLSHDLPKYIGGEDKDGRHWLCKKCHGIYEWRIIKFIWEAHTSKAKEILKNKIKKFSIKYFKKEDDPKTTTQ